MKSRIVSQTANQMEICVQNLECDDPLFSLIYLECLVKTWKGCGN